VSIQAGPRDGAGAQRTADIAGFRGFAALTVVVFHAWQFCRAGGHPDFAGTTAGRLLGGFDGIISWFFVTSAFLLYAPVARRLLTGQDPGSARGFLLRRVLRVLPVYWVAVLVVWAYRNPSLPGDWRDLVEHLTFIETFDSKRIFYTIGPAWTLSVEVAFYLFVALYLAVVRRAVSWGARRPVLLLAAPAALLLVASTGYRVTEVATGTSLLRWAVWFNPLGWAGDFALGMLLALVVAVRGGRPLSGLSLRGLRLVTAVIVVGALFLVHDTPSSFVRFHSLTAVGYALLLSCSVLAPATSLWRAVLAWRPLVWVGTLSFSLYVWHEPLLLLLDRHGLVSHDPAAFPAVAITLCLLGTGVGWLGYHVLELPLRNLGHLVAADGRLAAYYPARSGTLDAGAADVPEVLVHAKR